MTTITDIKVAYPRAFSGIFAPKCPRNGEFGFAAGGRGGTEQLGLELLPDLPGTLQNDAYPMTQMALSDVNLDLDLLRRLRAGDADAMSALYRRHQGPLYRFALLRCGSSDVAADVVQDVFVALIENKLSFDPTRGSLASFLFGVARNFALKREEAQRRHLPLPTSTDEDGETIDLDLLDPAPLPVESLLASERAEAVRAALAQLAPHYRDVLILYELQDQSYVEIAQICNIDIGTVRSRLSRARAKLLELLSDESGIRASGDKAVGSKKTEAMSRSASRAASQ